MKINNRYILTENKKLIDFGLLKFKIIENVTDIQGINNLVICFSYSKIIDECSLQNNYFYNIHNSLLPRYRGLHAFTWAIINNESKVGYTLHRMTKEIDNGNILKQWNIDLNINDSINDVFVKANKLLKDIVFQIDKGYINFNEAGIPQDESKAIFVGKRRPEDGKINWNSKALEIHNLIRALTPPYTPGAFTYYKNEPLYIVDSEIQQYPNYIGINGQVVNKVKGKGVLVKCNDTVLLIKNIIYKNETINSFDFFKTVGARLG